MIERNARVAALSVIAVVFSLRAIGADVVDREHQLTRYMESASKALPLEQQSTLARIENEDRRNLAMTYYLRAGAGIGARWSWTQAQIDAYRQSAEFKQALAEIAKISSRFTQENPKYHLFVNAEVRSLEEQIQRWRTVRSIGTAGSELRRAAADQLGHAKYEATPSEKSLTEFLKFLTVWRASPPPTLAAPGLSLHGRGRAYDFQVRDAQDRTVAGTDSSSIRTVWDAEGWTLKLSKAVHEASDRFVGPLEAPARTVALSVPPSRIT